MIDSLGLRHGALALLPHDPVWAQAFTTCHGALVAMLPVSARIHHIGSTAVPGLLAKPILDIGVALSVADHGTASDNLTAAGWIARGPRSGLLFIKVRDTDLRTHNLHLYGTDSADLREQIKFRDLLRSDAALRSAYAAHKQAIVAAGTERGAYADAKTAFIQQALR